MIGEVIAESTLLKFVMRLHQALEAWELDAIEQILKAPAINVDETSLRVDKRNHWLHVYSARAITLKFLHRKRGKAAIVAIDIIPRYGGVIIQIVRHRICPIFTAVTGFAARICCAN